MLECWTGKNRKLYVGYTHTGRHTGEHNKQHTMTGSNEDVNKRSDSYFCAVILMFVFFAASGQGSE